MMTTVQMTAQANGSRLVEEVVEQLVVLPLEVVMLVLVR